MQISFPISWLVYSVPRGWRHVSAMHYLAPFVVLGIGLDDIFVAVAFFRNTRPFLHLFALDTRLSASFSSAASTMLATHAPPPPSCPPAAPATQHTIFSSSWSLSLHTIRITSLIERI
jgi:hypothetical protein